MGQYTCDGAAGNFGEGLEWVLEQVLAFGVKKR
jgi:hypothetical protein